MDMFNAFLAEFSRTHADYLSAWMVYLGCMILAFVVFWRMTQGMRWSWLQQSLRLMLALILMMPTQALDSTTWVSPAVMALAMHVLSGHHEQMMVILQQYLYGAGVCVLVLLCMQLWRLKPKAQAD